MSRTPALLLLTLTMACRTKADEGVGTWGAGTDTGAESSDDTAANPTALVDEDGDGVDASVDCDDADPTLGALLLEDALGEDLGTFSPTEELGDHWHWGGASVFSTQGRQQAMLASPEDWGDVMVQARVRLLGTRSWCGFDCATECEVEPPEDCWSEAQAVALGLLSASGDGDGVIFENTDATPVCLSAGAAWSDEDGGLVVLSEGAEVLGSTRVAASSAGSGALESLGGGDGGLVLGKVAHGGSGQVEVVLSLREQTGVDQRVQLHDALPATWELISCDRGPDATRQDGDQQVLDWTIDLVAGGSEQIRCALEHVLSADVSMETLPAAWTDGGETSDEAVVAGYDHNGDGQVGCFASDRWRFGLLGRAALDDDQDEGYHGYRCALAHNEADDCFPEGGFVQLAEFKDVIEDDIDSEDCEDCVPNPSFDQLSRVDHRGAIDPTAEAELHFWMVGSDLRCEVSDEAGHLIRATARDRSLEGGTVGLSTLSAFGDFRELRVCEALAMPE